MRAVFRASFAARRKALPTPAAKLRGRFPFVRVFAFTDSSPVIVVPGPNCRPRPSCGPTGGRCAESNDVSPRHIMAALTHPGSDALRDAIAQDETLLATLEARWKEQIRPPAHYGTLRHNPSMASSAI